MLWAAKGQSFGTKLQHGNVKTRVTIKTTCKHNSELSSITEDSLKTQILCFLCFDNTDIVNAYNQKAICCNTTPVERIAGCKFIMRQDYSTDDYSDADDSSFNLANKGRSDYTAASAVHKFPTGKLNKICT